jgi:hypothetical protein
MVGFLHFAAGVLHFLADIQHRLSLSGLTGYISFGKLLGPFNCSDLCTFPHIQMLSKRLLFGLKPVEKKVSILNLALSVSVARNGANDTQGGDPITTPQTI